MVCLHIIPDQSCCFRGTVDCSIEFVACLEDIRNISYTVEFESIFLTCNAYNWKSECIDILIRFYTIFTIQLAVYLYGVTTVCDEIYSWMYVASKEKIMP